MPILLQLAQSYSNPESVNYKLAYLREQMEEKVFGLGDLAYEDQVQLAMLGDTIIVGGYLRTELIAAKSILAEHLNVDSLSAISADLGAITAGSISGVTITGGTVRTNSGDNRIELSNNLLRSYRYGIQRVQLDYDSLDFYNAAEQSAGGITAGSTDQEVYTDKGRAEISVTDFQISTSEHGSITLYSQSSVTGKSASMFIRTGGRTPDNANYNGEIKLQVWNGSDATSPYIWLRDTQDIMINAPNGVDIWGTLDVGDNVYVQGKIYANGGIDIPDTRDVVDDPQDLPGRAISFAFKRSSTVGNPPVTSTNSTYSHIIRVAGWSTHESSGGWPTELSVGAKGIAYRQATSATTWGAWKKIWSQDNDGSGSGLDADLLDGKNSSYFQPASDERLKTDIQPITTALEKVLALQGVSFVWNEKAEEIGAKRETLAGREIGLIAQQVAEVVPEVILDWIETEDGEKYKTVDTARMVALLVEAIKELNAKVAAIEQRLEGEIA